MFSSNQHRDNVARSQQRLLSSWKLERNWSLHPEKHFVLDVHHHPIYLSHSKIWTFWPMPPHNCNKERSHNFSQKCTWFFVKSPNSIKSHDSVLFICRSPKRPPSHCPLLRTSPDICSLQIHLRRRNGCLDISTAGDVHFSWCSLRQLRVAHILLQNPTYSKEDVEKVHAVVARSTFRSKKWQNTTRSDHFWKLRCWQSARRCGAKHILK